MILGRLDIPFTFGGRFSSSFLVAFALKMARSDFDNSRLVPVHASLTNYNIKINTHLH